MNEIKKILKAFKAGKLDESHALSRLKSMAEGDIGFARVDHHRRSRTGSPEIVFGAGKSASQIVGIVGSLIEAGERIFITRIDARKAKTVLAAFPSLRYCETASIVTSIVETRDDLCPGVVIAAAGTSDIPVGEEAYETLLFFGIRAEKIYDISVAGIHRLFSHRQTIADARVLIVIAGMEGALPSVVGGLTRAPIIAVPTSVGYGASFGGLSALLAMLNSCAPGVGVVNIDNGFGAGYLAAKIIQSAR